MICEVILSRAVAPAGDFIILTILSPRTGSPLSLTEEYWDRCPEIIKRIKDFPGTSETGRWMIELTTRHLEEFKHAVDMDWTFKPINNPSPMAPSAGSTWPSTTAGSGVPTPAMTITVETVTTKGLEVQDAAGLTLKEDWSATMDWTTTGSIAQVPLGCQSQPSKWVPIYTRETSGIVTKRHIPVW